MIRRVAFTVLLLCTLIAQALPAAAHMPLSPPTQGARERPTRIASETLRGHGPVSPGRRDDRLERGLSFDWRALVSPDLRRFARVQPAGGPLWVALDGQVFPRVGELLLLRDVDELRFSADSSHFAYSGINGAGEWVVVADGETQATYSGGHSLLFSPVGNSLAYVAESSAGQYLVVDGIGVGSYYPAIVEDRLLYSADGSHIAYVAQTVTQPDAQPEGEEGEQFVVFNGREGAAYDAIDRLVFGEGASVGQLAYVAATGNSVRVVLASAGESVEGPLHDEIHEEPVFLAEGEGVVYAARDGERWTLMRLNFDGEERGPEYDDLTQPVVGPDGTLGYGATEGERTFVVTEGEEGPGYDAVFAPVFSPDGSRVAYVAIRGNQWLVVIDGEESALYGDVSEPIFSDDSSRVAYAAMSATVSGDIASGPTVQRVSYTERDMGSLWSTGLPRAPLGASLGAPQAQNGGQWRWIIDGQETQTYDLLLNGPDFSPDGSRFAFAAIRDDRHFVVVVDETGEHAGKAYESIFFGDAGSVRFDDDSSFHYLAAADNPSGTFADVWLVEERILGEAQPGTIGIGDPLYPTLGNGGYDAQHYTVELDYDPATNVLTGTTTMTARSDYALNAFNLDFQGFEITETTVNGEAAQYARAGSELTVIPDATLAAGALFTVSVSYGGMALPGQAAADAGDWTLGWRTTLSGTGALEETAAVTTSATLSETETVTEPITEAAALDETRTSSRTSASRTSAYLVTIPNGASALFPVNDHLQDKATYTFRVRVPAPYMAVANGVQVETVTDETGATGATYVWQVDDPMSSHFAEVVVAELEMQIDETHSAPIYRYFQPGLPEAAPTEFERIGEMLDYFAELFGPYPFPSYGIVQVDDPWRGYAIEAQGLGLYTRPCTGEPLPDSLAPDGAGNGEGDGDEGETDCQELGVVAEVAHQWFGGSITPKTWRDVWINEAFAVYAGWLWREHTEGAGAFDAQKRNFYAALTVFPEPPDAEGDFTLPPALAQWLLAADNPPPATPAPHRLLGGGVIARAALSLHALRLRVGDEIFFEILRTFAERFRHSSASTADFFAVAEEVSGEDLGEFFDSWFYAYTLPPAETVGGFPTLTVVAPALNVRSGPGTNYTRIDGAAAGDVLEIIGQTFDCGWFQIRRADGSEGWVAGGAQYVTFTTLCSAIPAAEVPDAPPPPAVTTAPLTDEQATANIESAVASIIGQPTDAVLVFFDTIEGTSALIVIYQTGFDPGSQSGEIATQHRRAVFAAVDALVRAASRPEGMIVMVFAPGAINEETPPLRGSIVLRSAAEAWSNGQLDDNEFAETWGQLP